MNLWQSFKNLFSKKPQETKTEDLDVEIDFSNDEVDFYIDLTSELYEKTHGVKYKDMSGYADSEGKFFLYTKDYPIKKDYFLKFVDEVIKDGLMEGDDALDFKYNFLIYAQPNLVD